MAVHTSLNLYSAWMLRIARASSLLFFYGVFASMAAANIGMAMTLVFWLLSAVWIEKFREVLRSPLTLPIAATLLVTLLSLSYTEAPFHYSERYFLVYGKWLFVLVLINLHDDPKWLKAIVTTIILATVIVLVSTYANVFFEVPWANSSGGLGADNSVFYDYTAQGIMSVCVSLVAWVVAFRSESKLQRLLAALVFVLLAFSVFFLLPSRTGQLTMVVSLLAVSAIIFSKRYFLIFLATGAAALGLALLFSPVLFAKIQLVIHESIAYVQRGHELTSVGARLSMWSNSINFIADAPLLGHGVGSYRYLSEKVYLDPAMCAVSCVHPHNQWLFFMVEYGLAGLTLFYFFVRAFLRLALDWRAIDSSVFAIVVGFGTVFLVDSFINSPLWISSLRNFYIGVFALISIHHALIRKGT